MKDTEHESKLSRRAALASLAAGSTFTVSQWKTPVVNQIILPAHAEMTVMAMGFDSGTTGDIQFTFPNSN